MNVDVVGRIRPSNKHDEIKTNGFNFLGSKISHQSGGRSFSFRHLHQGDTSNHEVYHQSVAPLLNNATNGYNTCIIVAGESGAGKSLLVGGENTERPGIIQMVIENLFNIIGEGDEYYHDQQIRHKQRVTLEMYEIYNEEIRDLLLKPKSKHRHLELGDQPDIGVFVKKGKKVSVDNTTDGVTAFRQGWARRTAVYTDFGPAKNFSSVLFSIDILLRVKNEPHPVSSRLTFVVLPGLEKLSHDSIHLRIKEGSTLSQGLVAFTQLVAALANRQYADRVVHYRDSAVTSLLEDQLGGNCQTRVIMCLKPDTSASILSTVINLSSQLVNVINYPIKNNYYSESLITQYRARIIDLSKQLGTGVAFTAKAANFPDEREEIKRLMTENLELRDRNERLHLRWEQMQESFGTMVTTKTDLSTQLLMTEEEKDKISKTLLEMHMKNNQLKEEAEAEKIKLKDKILLLEHKLTEVTADRDKQARLAQNARELVKVHERDRRELIDEYKSVKANFIALQKEIQVMSAKNEELSVELLSLVNAKAALMRQMDTMIALHGSDREGGGSRRGSPVGDPQAEIDRVRAIISRLAHSRIEFDMQKDMEKTEQNLLGNKQRFDMEMQKIRKQYEDNQQKLEDDYASLKRRLNDASTEKQELRKQVSELNAQYLTTKSLAEHLQSQNNRLQHKLKQETDDYRSRLNKYIQDVAEFIDRNRPSHLSELDDGSLVRLQQKVSDMMKDMKRAHRVREEQLSSAAQSYRERAKLVARKHEELLVAYRDLRDQISELNDPSLQVGPDESSLQISDHELMTSQQREINKLQDQLVRVTAQLENQDLKNRLGDERDKKPFRSTVDVEDKIFQNLKRQLKEFTSTTQQQLEDERSRLLTENSVLKEELERLKEYVDKHVMRYKEETRRLREMLGISHTHTSPPPPPSHLPQVSPHPHPHNQPAQSRHWYK